MHKVDRRMFVIVLSHPLLPPKKKNSSKSKDWDYIWKQYKIDAWSITSTILIPSEFQTSYLNGHFLYSLSSLLGFLPCK